MRKLLWILLLPACTTHASDCSALMTCNAGGYKLCQQGSLCWYSLTDGSSINCESCGNCSAAVQTVQSWCGSPVVIADMTPPADMARPTQSLPDLMTQSAGLVLSKTGPPYTGPQNDPGLNSENDCNDSFLEPDDDPGTALSLPTPVPDMPTPKIIKLAICPKGPSPFTGRHDEDWYKLDNTGGPPLTFMAEIFYDISLGDLDVAITDAAGNLLSSDGTAVSNGCAAAAIGSGVYFVAVVGADDQGVNTYELLARTFSGSQFCP